VPKYSGTNESATDRRFYNLFMREGQASFARHARGTSSAHLGPSYLESRAAVC